jgi:hypothetical protein
MDSRINKMASAVRTGAGVEALKAKGGMSMR